jgi:xanthine dehydrogenase accessory factor
VFSQISEQLQAYALNGETVALAQVVYRKQPSSGKPGDKAIITSDGQIHGWIGGGCVRGIAASEGMKAIEEGKYRLVKIAPEYDTDYSDDHVKIYKMTCHSGGSMEIFIEPVMPNPHLIIAGKSNISKELARMAKAAHLRVSVLARNVEQTMFPDVDFLTEEVDFQKLQMGNNSYIIVATQGDSDEEAVLEAMKTEAGYVGFVASARKSKTIKDYLQNAGIDDERIQQLRTPVGLDINAKVPTEVAVSILADIIKDFRSAEPVKAKGVTESPKERGPELAPLPEIKSTKKEKKEEGFFINPVCNLPISKADAKYVIAHGDHTLYFCCDGCKVSFENEPEKYLAIMEKSDG